MRRALLKFLIAAMAALSVAALAHAQGETKKSPFGVPIPTEQTTSAKPQGVLGATWLWVMTQQQRLNREMAAAVREMKTGSLLNATLILAFVSFAYGVLHAAGPGHGKAVISSYVLANERTLRRGIMLSFLSAFIQALSAIAIVGVLAIALNATSLEIKATEAWIETVSWGLVALIGVWLLYGQVRALLVQRAAAGARVHGHDDGHHTHHHDCGHGHEPGHVHDASCGHAHMPDPKELEGKLSWRKALAIAGSVGIRPCTGAILVLIFALSQGILVAGIFATFAMALGTAITVSFLASLALGSRELAVRLAGGDSRWTAAVATGAGLLGSSLVLLLGATFFVASLRAPAPF